MSRKRRSQKTASPNPNRTNETRAVRRKLSATKRVLFAVATTGGFFVLIEIVLALSGVKPVLFTDDPYVGFASHIPLFVKQSGPGAPTHMATAANKASLFNAQRFPAKKDPGTYRIFCLGGSTTYGRPYTDTASFSGWLRELLPLADPTHQWEVINAGGISYASYRVCVVMEELIEYEPDLFIIYSGHNEFLEQRTYSGLIGGPGVSGTPGVPGVSVTEQVLSHTRIYTALKSILVRPEPDPSQAILEGEVDAILDRSVGLDEYSRDDALQGQVIAHYRFNLNRMIDIARSVGAHVLLVTPASNLKDCSPFKSEHRSDLDLARLRRFEVLLMRAREAQAGGRLDDALATLDQATAIDDRHAHVHYQRGQILYDLGEYEQAKASLRRALDEDICPLRILTPMRKIIEEVAAEQDVPLLDFAALIEGRADHGIPGSETFLDHVHLKIDGYKLLALELIKKLSQRDVVHLASGWNEAAVEAVARNIESRIDKRAHGTALRNLAMVFSWAGKLEEAGRLAAQAQELLGDEAEPSYLLGVAANARGDFEQAIHHYREAVRIQPNHARAHNNLGISLAKTSRLDEAIRHYQQALAARPDFAQPYNNLANVFVDQRRFDHAVRHYRRAIQINPDFFRAHNNLGDVLREQGKTDDAIKHHREALRINPNYAEAHHSLGIAFRSQGKIDDAMGHYLQSVQIKPDYADVHLKLANLLLTQGKAEEAINHYGQALRTNPDLVQAHLNLGTALQSQGKLSEAIDHFREALRIKPDYAMAHNNLGSVLGQQGKLDEAIHHYEQAIEIKPDYADAKENLRMALRVKQQKAHEAEQR